MTIPLARIKARLWFIRAELDALEKDLEACVAAELNDSPWMRTAQYAAYAKVSADTVRNWIAQGMPHVGKGKLTRIHRDEADAWRRER